MNNATALEETLKEMEARANLPGWAKISKSDVAWYFENEKPEVARVCVMNAMWREGHPGWRKRTRRSYVYFIKAENVGLVKIGYSDRPEERLKSIQGMSPVPLRLLGWMPGSQQDERDLHARFAHLHSHGEWFRVDDDLAALIEEVPHGGSSNIG